MIIAFCSFSSAEYIYRTCESEVNMISELCVAIARIAISLSRIDSSLSENK